MAVTIAVVCIIICFGAIFVALGALYDTRKFHLKKDNSKHKADY
ncbi:MAG TPA: hypothetical protein VFS36_01200 [Chitinophagaceae bacterium]|jgi:hypothetical protein|nr:hypothetical protein [Chitinophagaceae bacterium]